MSHRSIQELVGKNIARRRKLLEMSQEKLAEKIGVAQESLSRMEQGRMAPKFSRLQSIADVLNCSVVDIFRRQEEDMAVNAESIAEIMNPLPKEAQDEILEIVAKMGSSLFQVGRRLEPLTTSG